MNFKNIIYLIGAFMLLAFSTLASWYEGAQLRDIPWEWKYTAVFSNWINGGVGSENDILAIDHFVYASKFEPLYPLLMAISLLFIVLQLAAVLLKNQKTVHTLFLVAAALVLFVLSGLLMNSPTTGLTLFSVFFGAAGIAIVAGVFFLHSAKWKQRTSMHKVSG